MLTAFSVLSSSIGPTDWVLKFALLKTLCMISGLGLSHLWRNYLRQNGWVHRHKVIPFRRIILGLSVMGIIQTAILVLFDTWIRNGVLISDRDLPILLLLFVLLWGTVFSVWTLCYFSALSRRKTMQLELQKLEFEVSIKDTELRALQAQVNPHFFFNSLNSINSLVYQDAGAATRAISLLADMMRYNLQSGRAKTVSLTEELTAIHAYLGMEKLRFEERLQLSVEIDPCLNEIRLPPMALQTLVENAIKYGVERNIGACQLRIEARRQGDFIQLSVNNQGRLIEVGESTQLGLANTRKRLSLIFGAQARCTLEQKGEWVVACLILPMERI